MMILTKLGIVEMKKRFAKIYEWDFIDSYGAFFWGFKTPFGTRFFVDGLYEWNTVFLTYDDGEDGDQLHISDYDGNDQIFEERSNEIRTTEQDERNALVNTYRIYKTIPVAEGTKLLFRFWGSSECVEQLYAHKTVAINNSAYKYKKGEDSIQAIIIETEIKEDLYDRWIQFI